MTYQELVIKEQALQQSWNHESSKDCGMLAMFEAIQSELSDEGIIKAKELLADQGLKSSDAFEALRKHKIEMHFSVDVDDEESEELRDMRIEHAAEEAVRWGGE